MRQGTSIYSGKQKHEKTRVPPNSFWEGNQFALVAGAIGLWRAPWPTNIERCGERGSLRQFESLKVMAYPMAGAIQEAISAKC